MHCSRHQLGFCVHYSTLPIFFLKKKRMFIIVISQVLYPSRIVIVPTPYQTLKLADKWCNDIITWEGLVRM